MSDIINPKFPRKTFAEKLRHAFASRKGEPERKPMATRVTHIRCGLDLNQVTPCGRVVVPQDIDQ